jgi:hypothetical protein
MSGKNPRMNPLKSRKQLLIAESELNRAQLVRDWQTMADDIHALTKQARTIGSIASGAVALISGLSWFSRKKSPPVAEKSSWLQTILKGAQTVGALWSQFHSPDYKESDK